MKLLRYILQPLLLAGLAFATTWFTGSQFDDGSARWIVSMTFASYVAVGSGLTGFLLNQMEGN